MDLTNETVSIEQSEYCGRPLYNSANSRWVWNSNFRHEITFRTISFEGKLCC